MKISPIVMREKGKWTKTLKPINNNIIQYNKARNVNQESKYHQTHKKTA